MKTPLVLATVFTALCGLTGLTSTANAGVDVDVHIGLPPPPHVILGGDDHHRDRGHHRDWDRRGGRDWDRRGGRDWDRGRDHRYDRDHGPRGYWKEVVVKTWVPGRVVVSCDRYGREIRHRERGHYVYRTDRVWVRGRG